MKLKHWASVILALIITVTLYHFTLGGATFSRVKTWSTGGSLTASDLNAEFDNILDNLDPDGVDDSSTNAAAMNLTADPYPSASASLATDLTGEIQRLRYLIKQITGESYWYVDPEVSLSNFGLGFVSRAQFEFKDADEIYIGPGIYHHSGTTAQMVYWNSKLTFELESAGTNSDSDDYGTDGWHYIYIDDSAVVTNASPLLVAACFLNDMTAPTYSVAKHGWYNENDRCIFAVFETGSAYKSFIHDGGTLQVTQDGRQAYSGTVNTTFVDLDLTAYLPGFATTALATASVEAKTNDALHRYIWRTNGQDGSVGHYGLTLERIGTDQQVEGVLTVVTDTAQILEHKSSNAATAVDLIISGWYFPRGM